MDSLLELFNGLSIAGQPDVLLAAALGVTLGTIVGLLPGLGPLTAMALLLPLSVHLEPIPALVLVAGIYYGAMYGGSITAILMNLPGEAASVATCIDGYQLRLRGRAGPALGIAAIGSFAGGLAGVLLLTLLAGPLASAALRFGPPEYFAIAAVGLSLTALLTGGRGLAALVRGLVSVALGLLIASVGIDVVTGRPRFTFGQPELLSGIDLIVVVLGLFAVGEVLAQRWDSTPPRVTRWLRPREVMPTREDMRLSAMPIARSTALGFGVGIIPGAGASIASFLAYAMERRVARQRPGRIPIGKGAIEGVAAPESANNAAVQGAFVPLLALGIPGSASSAVLLGAFIVQGIQPGPTLFQNQPDVVWGLIASMLIGNVLLLILNLPLAAVFVQVLRIPYGVLTAITILLALVGAYSIKQSLWDIALVLVLGMLSYLLRIARFPLVPVILGVVLGPLLERSYYQSMIISGDSLWILVSRPIPLALYGIVLIGLAFSLFRSRSRRSVPPRPLQTAERP